MKKYILIILVILVCSCGTDQGDSVFYNYTIINSSGVTVEIIPYNIQGNKEIDKKIILLNNQSLNQNYEDLAPYGGFSMIGLLITYFNKTVPSKIEIVFNNTKKVNYSDCTHTDSGMTINCDETRNIFRDEFSNEQKETYIITPEDYQNAIDCGGSCN